MSEPAKRRATYDDLYTIPDNTTGEIMDGELVLTPRPSARHSNLEFVLSTRLGPPYRFGEGGPGGWVILLEQEIMFGEDLLVPDFSGWRKGRFPGIPEKNWISVPPDWVCEILSPSSASLDRVRKMPIYAQHGVQYLWLMNPIEKTLEVYRLESGRWFYSAAFAGDDKARAEPFQEIELNLADFWMD